MASKFYPSARCHIIQTDIADAHAPVRVHHCNGFVD